MSSEMLERTKYTGHRGLRSYLSSRKLTAVAELADSLHAAPAPLNPPWLFIPKPHFLCSARNDWAPWAFYKPQPCLPDVDSSNEQRLLGDSHSLWCDFCRMDMGSCVLPTQSLLSLCPFTGLGLNCCLRLFLPTLAPSSSPLFLADIFKQTLPPLIPSWGLPRALKAIN